LQTIVNSSRRETQDELALAEKLISILSTMDTSR
jgi:hypothetical protein